jgi:hypothetical protein
MGINSTLVPAGSNLSLPVAGPLITINKKPNTHQPWSCLFDGSLDRWRLLPIFIWTHWWHRVPPYWCHSTIRFALDTTRKTLHKMDDPQSIHPSIHPSIEFQFASSFFRFHFRLEFDLLLFFDLQIVPIAQLEIEGLDWIGSNSFVLIMRSEWSYQDSRINWIQLNSIDKVRNRIQFNSSPTSMLSTGVLSIGVASRCSSRFQWLSWGLFISILTLTVARVEIEAIGPYLQCLRNQCFTRIVNQLKLTVARVEIEAIGPYLQCLRNQCFTRIINQLKRDRQTGNLHGRFRFKIKFYNSVAYINTVLVYICLFIIQ